MDLGVKRGSVEEGYFQTISNTHPIGAASSAWMLDSRAVGSERTVRYNHIRIVWVVYHEIAV